MGMTTISAHFRASWTDSNRAANRTDHRSVRRRGALSRRRGRVRARHHRTAGRRWDRAGIRRLAAFTTRRALGRGLRGQLPRQSGFRPQHACRARRCERSCAVDGCELSEYARWCSAVTPRAPPWSIWLPPQCHRRLPTTSQRLPCSVVRGAALRIRCRPARSPALVPSTPPKPSRCVCPTIRFVPKADGTGARTAPMSGREWSIRRLRSLWGGCEWPLAALIW